MIFSFVSSSRARRPQPDHGSGALGPPAFVVRPPGALVSLIISPGLPSRFPARPLRPGHAAGLLLKEARVVAFGGVSMGTVLGYLLLERRVGALISLGMFGGTMQTAWRVSWLSTLKPRV